MRLKEGGDMGKKKKGARGTGKNTSNRPNSARVSSNSSDGESSCSHVSKGVRLSNLNNTLPHKTLKECEKCEENSSSPECVDDVGSDEQGVCICLKCGHQGCDRSSQMQHALKHFQSNAAHPITLHLDHWIVWCYSCDAEIQPEQHPEVASCVSTIRKILGVKAPVATNDEEFSSEVVPIPGKIHTIVRGLSNLGNTCFFNSVMQNLVHSCTMLNFMTSALGTNKSPISLKPKKLPHLEVTVSEKPGQLTAELFDFLKEMAQTGNKNNIVSPRKLFQEISRKAPRFRGFRQQDSQELLRYLLDGVRSEEIRRIKLAILKAYNVEDKNNAVDLPQNTKEAIKDYGRYLDSSTGYTFIDQMFCGQWVSTVLCMRCNKASQVYESFLDVSLPIIQFKQVVVQERKGGKQKQQSVPAEEKQPPMSKHQRKKAAREAKKAKKKGVSPHSKKGEKADEGGDDEDAENEEENTNEEESNQENSARSPSTLPSSNPPSMEADLTEDGDSGVASLTCSSESVSCSSNSSSPSQTEILRRQDRDHEEGESRQDNAESQDERPSEECLSDNGVRLEMNGQSLKDITQIGDGASNGSSSLDSEDNSSTFSSLALASNTSLQVDLEVCNPDPCCPHNSKTEDHSQIPSTSANSCDKIISTIADNTTCTVSDTPSANISEVGNDLSVQTNFDTLTCLGDGRTSLAEHSNNCCTSNITQTSANCSTTSENKSEESFIDTSVERCQAKSTAENEESIAKLENAEGTSLCCSAESADSRNELQTGEKEVLCSSVKKAESVLSCEGTEKSSDDTCLAENFEKSLRLEPDSNSNEDCFIANGMQKLKISDGFGNSVQDKTKPESKNENEASGSSDVGSMSADVKELNTKTDTVCESDNVSSTVASNGSSIKQHNCDGTEDNVEKNNSLVQQVPPSSECSDAYKQESTDGIEVSVLSSGTVKLENSGSSTSEGVCEKDGAQKEEVMDSHCSQNVVDGEEKVAAQSDKVKTRVAAPYKPTPGECSVMSLLAHFCAEEMLTGKNQFRCSNCNSKTSSSESQDSNSSQSEDDCEGAKACKSKEPVKAVYSDASKRIQFSKLPPVLTFHLKRFDNIGARLKKNNQFVEFPETLDMAPFCAQDDQEQDDSHNPGHFTYELCGLVEHSGSLNAGHYVAYVKSRKTSQWSHISDSRVNSVQESRVFKTQAYLLFYQRTSKD